MPWSLLASALAGCQLRELVLENTGRQDGVDDEAVGGDIFRLDQLEILSILNVSRTLANRLVGCIRAPSLNSFELDTTGSVNYYRSRYMGEIVAFDALVHATPSEGESLFASLVRRHPHDCPVEVCLTHVLGVLSSSNTDDHPGCRFKIKVVGLPKDWFSRLSAPGWALLFATVDLPVVLKIHTSLGDLQDLADAGFLQGFPTLSELWIPATWDAVMTYLSEPLPDAEGHTVWPHPKLTKVVLLVHGEDVAEIAERFIQTVGHTEAVVGEVLLNIQVLRVPMSRFSFLRGDTDVFKDLGQFVLPRRLLHILHWDSGRSDPQYPSTRL
ncbi:hypothetical protein FRB99_006643 [Tulasnella sp. 403]|nr:hypothetical protein FRB99_006643 [Tulasnella sp. 403]